MNHKHVVFINLSGFDVVLDLSTVVEVVHAPAELPSASGLFTGRPERTLVRTSTGTTHETDLPVAFFESALGAVRLSKIRI